MFRWIVLLLLLLTITLAWQDGGSFGFSGMEIYKTDLDTRCLLCIDLNSDGLNDFLFANNQRASIDIYYQKTLSELHGDLRKPPTYDDLNEIPSDARFRKEVLYVEKKIYCLIAGDLNNDSKPDLAFYGDPKELVIIYQTQTGFDKKERFDIKDGSTSPRSLLITDLNQDGLNDLVLLGVTRTYVLVQKDGRFKKPEQYPNSEKDLTAIHLADVDGNNLKDIIYFKSGSIYPVRVRLQQDKGLSPEIFFELPQLRHFNFTSLNQDQRQELACIQDVTGRLSIYSLQKGKQEGVLRFGSPVCFGLSVPDERKRIIQVADVDSDTFTDIVVLYPNSSLAEVFSSKGAMISSVGSFPTYSGITQAQVTEIGQRKAIVLLSVEEGVIGYSMWEKDGLLFPKQLLRVSNPLCMRVYTAGKIAVVSKSDKDDYFLRCYELGKDESIAEHKLSKIKEDPCELFVTDLNGDNQEDFLVLMPTKPFVAMLSTKEGYKEMDVDNYGGKGIIYGVKEQAFAIDDLDGDGKKELFASKKNFVRVFNFAQSGNLEVLLQCAVKEPDSEVVGLSVADLDNDRSNEILICDKKYNQGHIYHKSNADYEVVSGFKLPPVKFSEIFVVDLNKDTQKDIVITSDDKFFVYFNGGDDLTFELIQTYETDVKGSRLETVSSGDLNNDSRPEILLTDSAKRTMQILECGKEIKKVLGFEIFEEKRFHQPGSVGPVRELVVADVTNDGQNDILILLHDRVIVYFQ